MMLGSFSRAPSSEQARLIAAGALAVLAVMAFGMIMLLPKRVDVSPDALSVDRLGSFKTDISACRAAIGSVGLETEGVSQLIERGGCGYSNAVELSRSVHPYSEPVVASCALAAGLVLWERDVVDPAAQRYFHQGIARIEMAGPTYACRPVAGRRDRRLSEHAHANAIDIKGFTLADGRVITVAQGWRGRREDRAFLRAVRTGACDQFQAVLSPDYNRAHHDHLHFDLGRDKLCR